MPGVSGCFCSVPNQFSLIFGPNLTWFVFFLILGCSAHCYLWMGHSFKYSKGKGHFDLSEGEVLAIGLTYFLITLDTRYVRVLLEYLMWQRRIYVGLFAVRSLSGSRDSVDQGVGFVFAHCQVQVMQLLLTPQFKVIVCTLCNSVKACIVWPWDSVVKRQITCISENVDN